MAVEPDADLAEDGGVDLLATAVALLVTVASLGGLAWSSDSSGATAAVGALFGAGIFGYLTYWIVRDGRSLLDGTNGLP